VAPSHWGLSLPFDWGWKMPKDVAAEYRARADKCRQQAEKSRDPANIAHWTKFAEQWLNLAQAAATAERRRQAQCEPCQRPTDHAMNCGFGV
jgi:hypothetical protein